MTPSSFESIRKQAKKLVRLAPAESPITLREAQLQLAREYGFAGWTDLRAAVLHKEAERAIHDHNLERLSQLVREHPTLLARSSLLRAAADSFGDSGDPNRERMFTRVDSAEFLLDNGAEAEPEIWRSAIATRSHGVLQLLASKRPAPQEIDILAALGDLNGVSKLLSTGDATVEQAFLNACRFRHRDIATLLLVRIPELQGREAFIDYLAEHPRTFGTPWQTVVMNHLYEAIQEDNLPEFTRWLKQPGILVEQLIENAVLTDRPQFITLLAKRTPHFDVSSAMIIALDYGKQHLIPLLTQISPLPDDLPHAAGTGNFARVQQWFDPAGRFTPGTLAQHYPTNNPDILRNLHWTPPNAQQILDTALAWACLNRHFDIAEFLLAHGANINTDWSTHEPASILHESAIHGDFEAAQFLIDHGIDLTIHDYRWNAIAQGWAEYASDDKAAGAKMAEFLAKHTQNRPR